MSRAAEPIEVRFARKYECCPMSGCWLWTDAPDSCGYGRLLVGQKAVKAHRVSWELHNGPIPGDLQVLHHCDTPPCVNPSHLFLGTHADNMEDRRRKGRTVVPVAPVMRGAEHPSAKLTDAIVIQLRAQMRRGLPIDEAEWAARLGVSQSTILRAMLGDTYRHLGDGTALDTRGIAFGDAA